MAKYALAVDGSKQRSALTAAEKAVRFLAAGDGSRATESAAKAAELDQIGVYAGLECAVRDAVVTRGREQAITPAAWASVRTALPPGPLQSLVDSLSG